MGDVFGVCEACHAPRSEQDMICSRCGYVFKTKPVPAYTSDRAAITRHHTEPPTIVDAARTVPTAPPVMTERTPPPPMTVGPTMKSRWFGADEAPRTLHSPSSPPAGERAPVPVAAWTPPPRSRSGAWPWLLAGAALLVALAAAGAILFLRARMHPPAVPMARQITWDGSATIAIGQLDASPAEDFAGRYHEVTPGLVATFVGVFSGDDMHEIWRAGPLGGPAIDVPFAVLGSHVLVADARAVLHVHDGATGKETHLIELADRATRISTHPTGGSEAFIEVANGSHVLFDVAAGKAKITSAPGWAPEPIVSRLRCSLGPESRSACLTGLRSPSVPGFTPRVVIGEGDVGIALGRGPTAPSLQLVAFTVASGAGRWQATVPSDPRYAPTDTEVLEMQGDQIVALWGVAAAQHVAAFGAKDGARRWDTLLPPTRFEAAARFVTLSPSRVYVPRGVRLDVLDRRTGAILGGIGAL